MTMPWVMSFIGTLSGWVELSQYLISACMFPPLFDGELSTVIGVSDVGLAEVTVYLPKSVFRAKSSGELSFFREE
jgi:hypothetical protein